MNKKAYQVPQSEYNCTIDCLTVIALSGGASYGTDGGDLVGGVQEAIIW